MSDFLTHLGIDDATSEDLRATPGPEHANDGGTVHGGFIATLLDASMGRAVRAGLDEGEQTVTAAMTITYLCPGTPGEEITTTTEVLRQGDSLAMVTGVATDPKGEKLAHAVGTFSVIAAG